MYGIYDHGMSCDFTVDQKSYGFYQSDLQADNSGSYLSSYFKYNRLTNWAVVEESTDDYFTEYGYTNNDWQTYEGRNGDDAVGANDDQNNQDNDDGGGDESDDGAQDEEEEENQAEIIVVNQMDSGYDPYEAFDIGNCDTYSHLWTYDLFLSCADGSQYCECSYTEELIEKGLLLCSDVDSCPIECGVCSNCIYSVCNQMIPSKIIAAGVGSHATAATAAIFSTILLAAFVAFRQRRENKKSELLNERLMDDNETSYTAKNWSVPVNEDGLPTEKSKTSKPVWLAPDVSTIPRKPLFPDLLKGLKVELSPVASNKRSSKSITKKKHHPGPLIVTSSDESIPSSISCTSDDSSGLSQQEETRSDGKSIGTMEGEI